MRLEMCCPHCEGELVVDLQVKDATTLRPKGRPPHEYPQEIYDFVIEGVEVWKVTYTDMARRLEERELRTPAGKMRWHASTVQRLYEHALQRKTETPN